MDDEISLAFTCKLPWVVLIMLGIKQTENRASIPFPRTGRCAVSCSRSSTRREYENFYNWASLSLPIQLVRRLPDWNFVSAWPGHLVGCVEYDTETSVNDGAWDEGLPYWWKLSHPVLLRNLIPCRGQLGMWKLPNDVQRQLAIALRDYGG